MKKRILTALAVFVLVSLVFSGCTAITTTQNFARQLLSGIPMSTVFKGEIGETMETLWLDFRVDSVEFVKEFDGEEADSDSLFLLVHITEQNTYEEATPLYLDDYFVDGVGMNSYAFPLTVDEETGEDLSYDGMRMDEDQLDVDESARWVLPFKVPKKVTDFTLTYYEYYDNDGVNEYIINFQQ